MVISSLFLDIVFPLTPMYDGNRMMAAVYSGIFLGAGDGAVLCQRIVVGRNRFSGADNQKEEAASVYRSDHASY